MSCSSTSQLPPPPDLYAGIKIVATFEADHANVPDDALPQVVYLSSREMYTSMIYQTRHCYLLLDPLSPDEIRDALRKALASKITRPSVPLALKSAGTVHVLFPKDIVIVKSVGRKVLVFCVGGQQHEAYAALSDIEDRLPETFVRCHKSYLVNMELASSMGNGVLTMRDGQTAPVSQRRLKAVREAMLNCGRAR